MSSRPASHALLSLALLLVLIISITNLPVTVHAGSSDLTVEGIWLEDASQIGQHLSQLSPGQSFNIIATIKNVGQETASGYYLDVYYDGDYGRGGPDNIAPGEVQTWYVGPLTAQAGTHTTTWVVDPDTQIAELVETNNQKELVFTVGSETVTTTVTSNSTSSTTESTSTTTTTMTSSSTSSTTQLTSTSTSSLLVTHALGWLPEDIPEDARVTPIVSAALPTHFDWTQKDGLNWMTSVKNQGGCGSCVAFSAVGALEGQLKIQANNPSWNTDLSEQHLFSCGGGTCSGGWYISSALNYLQQYGTPDEACSPYQGGSGSCSNSCPDWQSRAFKISSWNWVLNDPSAIEAAVMNGPVVAGFNVYTDFFSYNGGVYHYDGHSQFAGGHAIVIVGYDSNERYWIVKNSWGNWGENGYFKIGFGEAGIENYVATIRASFTTTYSITFYADPVGTITVDGVTKTNGATGTYGSGTRVHIVANPPSGYSFANWETSGVSIDSASSADTYIVVSSNGFLKAHFTMDGVGAGLVHAIVRGTDNGIYYSSSGWNALPGGTVDSPTAASCADRTYLAVRGTDNGIYYGYVTVPTNVFSGWTRLPGATPSAPALAAASDCTVYLSVRGTDNGIYLNTLAPNNATWTGWQKLTGGTVDGPAVTVAGSILHFGVRGTDGGIWHGMMDLTNQQWVGWSRISGATPSKMSLASTGAEVYLAVRGTDNRIYVNRWDGAAWTGWSMVPTGGTLAGPSMTIAGGMMYLAVQGTDNGIYWCSQSLSAPGWSSWTKLPGGTLSSPALA
jgi:C1A family cysteine protease